MTPIRRRARVAGFLYLLLVVAAPFRLLYIPGRLFVRGDAAATAANIAAHEQLFRLGIVSDLACGVIVVLVTLALYRLFESVDRRLGALMVITGGVLPAAIDFLNAGNDMAALILARGADFLAVFEPAQREALAFFFVRLHHQVTLGAEILWGLWLLPLALLVLRSRFLPRWLGYWLIVNGLAYLIESFTGLLQPQVGSMVANWLLPALLGEVAFMLWLVVRGAEEPVPGAMRGA